MSRNDDKALTTPGTEFAYTRNERRLNALRQARDRYGRFIAAGANVTWRNDGENHAGVVSAFDGENAIITPSGESKQNNTENVSVPMDELEVVHSKARLDLKNTKKYRDEEDNFQRYFNGNSVLEDLDEDGATVIRDDGYSVDITQEKKYDSSNPFMYQLFGPGGVSLGKYTGLTGAELDKIVEDYKKSQGEVVEGGETTAPEGGTGGQGGTAPVAASGDIAVVEPEIRPFRVPENVRQDVLFALENADDISDEDFKYASSLAFNDRVSINEVNWIHQFFDAQTVPQKLRGGYRGNKWASKIISQNTPTEEKAEEPVVAGAMFDDETYAYYAIGSEPGSTWAGSLISINEFTDAVYTWSDGSFELLEDTTPDDIDEPNIIPVDDATAEAFANWLSMDTSEDAEMDLSDIYTEERNLFRLAESEIDNEELNRITAIIADATGYSPLERGHDAERQRRGPGGVFREEASQQESSESQEGQKVVTRKRTSVKKTVLPAGMPFVSDAKSRIDEWMAYAPVLAAAEAPTEEEAPDPDSTAISEENSIYFAIVDEVDRAAVMDIVAITKNESGEARGWTRQDGEWVAAPDLMAQLQGSTPPPVVELDTPQPTKSVLAQIDQYDSQKPEEEEEPVTASAGFALPTGRFPIRNASELAYSVEAYEAADESEKIDIRNHIRKRAKALNRMDLVPEEWRTASSVDRGIALANQSPLYGEFGEVITASGVPGVADTPEDFKNVARLKEYWKNGAGAAKIRWGAPGDLTRCHRHLSKYMPGRAWGYCQNLHLDIFGESNYDSDN